MGRGGIVKVLYLTDKQDVLKAIAIVLATDPNAKPDAIFGITGKTDLKDFDAQLLALVEAFDQRRMENQDIKKDATFSTLADEKLGSNLISLTKLKQKKDLY